MGGMEKLARFWRVKMVDGSGFWDILLNVQIVLNSSIHNSRFLSLSSLTISLSQVINKKQE